MSARWTLSSTYLLPMARYPIYILTYNMDLIALLLFMVQNPHLEHHEILKHWERNELVQYAYQQSGWDMDFITTVERESWFSPLAIGDSWNSKGLCQWNRKPYIWNDSWFKDPYWQVDKCLETYNAYMAQGIIHKRLYGYNARHTVRERFSFPNK